MSISDVFGEGCLVSKAAVAVGAKRRMIFSSVGRKLFGFRKCERLLDDLDCARFCFQFLKTTAWRWTEHAEMHGRIRLWLFVNSPLVTPHVLDSLEFASTMLVGLWIHIIALERHNLHMFDLDVHIERVGSTEDLLAGRILRTIELTRVRLNVELQPVSGSEPLVTAIPVADVFTLFPLMVVHDMSREMILARKCFITSVAGPWSLVPVAT